MPFSFVSVIFSLILIIMVFLIIKWRLYIKLLEPIQKYFQRTSSINKAIVLICILVVLIQAFSSSILYFTDQDDMFYVGLSVTNIDSDRLFDFDPTTGDTRFPVMQQYKFQSWEIFLSVIAKMFNIPPAALFHTTLPFLLIILSYISYAYLFRHFISSKDIPLAIIFLSIFYALSDYSNYSQGSYLFTRLWQGKAILLHIVLPFCTSVILDHISKPSHKTILLVSLSFIAGIALNPIAIFILPIPILAILFINSIQTRQVSFKVWSTVIALIPLLIFAIGIRNGITSSDVYTSPSEGEVFKPEIWMNVFIGDATFLFVSYILISVVLFFDNNKNNRLYFVYLPLLYCLTLWNPYIAPYIGKYITSYATYWRVYWFLPLAIGYCMFIVKLINWKKYIGLPFALSLYGVMIFSGFNIIKQENIIWENIYKLPSSDVELTKYLEVNHPSPQLILAKESTGITIPQITNKLDLFWSRTDYIKDFLYRENNKEEYKRRLKLATIYNDNNKLTAEEILQESLSFGIDVIVVPKDSVKLTKMLDSVKMAKTGELGNYYIYNPSP